MAYDHITFTPQASAPASPALNEVYYKHSDDRLYMNQDISGSGGGAYDSLSLVPTSSPPTAARGRVYLDSDDDHLYVCQAT
jgi:hypothetical protein